MAVVQSLNSIVSTVPAWQPTHTYGSVRMYDQLYQDYATLYRTQPNVRTCVDFLARNIAQLGLHVFRRVSDTDRQRLWDHGLAQTIKRPNPFTTRYRLIESLMGDLGVWFNTYWLKLRANDGRLALLRVPPFIVQSYGQLMPTRYEVNLGTSVLKLTPDQIVHFRGYNAEDPIQGLSPLETLRRILAEEYAMGDYREHFWRNAARMSGIIERPAKAPKWSEAARAKFKLEFEALYSGGEPSGTTAILEEDMTWKQNAFSAQESEYLSGRKLTREECARAYHIPLPMVGILDHATFSNITEQHKMLYQDCLGPWLAMIEQDVELQLLPEFEDQQGIYVEFNIAEKLQGSFEEQTKALQSAIGRPYMTPDEGRAKMNLPSKGGDADELATPLNVLVGGQASPRDSAPKALRSGKADDVEPEISASLPSLRERHVTKWVQVLSKFFQRQKASIIGRVSENAAIETVWIDGERWNTELAADLYALANATATVWGQYVADLMESEFVPERMGEFLAVVMKAAAEQINAATMRQIALALLMEDPKGAASDLFEAAASTRAEQIASSRVTWASNFGAKEGAKQSGLKTKVWKASGGNSRESHAAMDGEAIGIDEKFSNGLRFPGDSGGLVDEVAGCHCSLAFRR